MDNIKQNESSITFIFKTDNVKDLANNKLIGALLITSISTLELDAISKEKIGLKAIVTFSIYIEKIHYTVLARIESRINLGAFFEYKLGFISISNLLFKHIKKLVVASEGGWLLG